MMSIYRSKHTKQYVVLPNSVAQDGSISMKASGLLHYMLSLPTDWSFNIQHLASHFEHDGKAAVKSGLKELEKAGYLVRKAHRDKSGQFNGSDWYVYDRKVKQASDQDDSSEHDSSSEDDDQDKVDSKDDGKQDKDDDTTQHAEGVIDMLNSKAGKRFRHSKSSLKSIKARLHDGYSSRDFAYVITNKVSEWKDTDMDKYLRPQTLFTDTHMEQYLNEKPKFNSSSPDSKSSQVSKDKFNSDDEDNLNEVLQSIK